MGNNTTAPNIRTKYEEYLPLSQLSHGKHLMRHKQTSQLTVVVEHTFPCEELLQEYIKNNKGSLSLTHQFYLNAFDYEVLSQTNICSKQYKIVEYFQHQPHTLHDQIQQRAVSDRPFTSKEIMSVLCSCVLAMSHISKLQLVHYTLNPSDIVLDQEGICKIVHPNLSQFVFDFNYQQNFYYAPETLKIFKMQAVSNGITNKSAVFTLGVTILAMVYLQDMGHLYNSTNFTVNIDKINGLVEGLRDNDLKSILNKMLKYRSYQRITFTQLEEMLYEVVSKAEGTGHRASFDNQKQQDHYQFSKLEESILRIRQENHLIDSRNMSFTTNSVVKSNTALPCYQAYDPLSADQEDNADQEAFLPCWLPDTVVMDEYEKNNPTQDEEYSYRQSLVSQHSKVEKMHYSQRIPEPLADCSNTSNSAYTENLLLYKHNKFEVFSPDDNFSFKKDTTVPKDAQEIPVYVTEQLKEGRYEGYKLGKYRHGFGTFYYKQGGKYCGEWFKNKMQGRGVLYYQSHKIAYEGEWKQDQLHGYGVLYNEHIAVLDTEFDYQHLELIGDSWIKFEGYFENDMKHGQGTLFLSNGQTFRGIFEKDHPNGWGQYRNVRGETIKGFWLMGALNSTQ